ncbi:TonB-dependent receptor [Aliidongia dinghuensis]|uniref:TonB-dependent receptor n=1 Tax=Aliidongia dinghuensis TaxID=1867774 RepID=A0A8J3E5T3_9PROT|nr:TonB-dependent receptor [Aliidongia dinghuensis]GGF50157.1 TonB-dependent receptor [Aliidongia dinghuensis]
MTLKSRLSGTVAVLALMPVFAAVPALAQSAPSQVAQAAPQTETIEVTGTRLKNTDAQSANPITVVSSEDIQKQAATTVEQVLLKLPSVDFNGGLTANSSNGGLGESQVSLRNLGPQRTLVLLNGQRFPFTDNNNASFSAVDLNNIPLSMIDHIEVLRDGASSVYGADAIGGVINIITKQHFNGVEIGGEVGETSYGDGLRHSVYSTAGADFDRGNILINVSTDHTDALFGKDRSWAVSQHPEADVNSYQNLSSRVTGAVGVINGSKYYFPSGLNSGVPASAAWTLGSVQVSPGVFAGGGISPGDLGFQGGGVSFNVLPTQGLTAGLDRQQLNFTTHYDLTPNVTAILEGFYTNRQSNEQLNPEPTGYNTPTPQFPNGFFSPATLPDGTPNLNNPTVVNPGAFGLASGVNVPILTRRFENGPRLYKDDVNTYRIRAALTGTVLGKYDWEAGYLYGKSAGTFNVYNETNFYHLSQELGMNACGSAPGCSVANVFGYNTLTPAQAKYLSFTNTDTSEYTNQEAYGHIGGPVYDLPAGPLNAAVGFEYRTESMFDHPDSIVSQGDGAIFALPTTGNYATSSGYVEVNAPLLSNLPFVKMLTADASGRYDYNTTFGKSLTYKVGLDYAINDDFRLRGNHSTGFRAPQLRELYSGLSQGEVGGVDPCVTGGTFAGSAACLASLPPGVTTATLTKINQITEATGGNPGVHPETSQEWTFGGVATPHWIPGLSVSVDYYTVLIRNEIGTLDAQSLVNACYGGVPYLVSQAQACKLVGPRTAGTGSLGVVQALNANVGAENTDGIDLDLAYGIDTAKLGLPAWGHLDFTGQVNYLLSDEVSSGGNTVKQAGTFGFGNGDDAEPRWKALLGTTFRRDNWSVNWTTRYYGGVKNVSRAADCSSLPASGICPTVGAGDFEGNEAAGVFYHDISGTYQYKNVNVTVGVDNLFDKDPPFLFPTGQTNAAGTAGYDFTGRFVYMKASIKF